MTSSWKLGLTFALVTVLMWGLLPLALKGVLGVMDMITITWYRFSLSAVVALLWYALRPGDSLWAMLKTPALPWSCLALFGLLANYLFYVFGLHYTNPGAAQILIQIAPLLLLIASVVFLKEAFRPVQWMGVATFSVGLLLFFHQRLSSSVETDARYLTGVLMMVMAATTWAGYGLGQKQLLRSFHARDILLFICLGGSVLLLPFSEPGQIFQLNSAQFSILLFCGLNTVVAYGAFGLALSHWEASRVSAIVPLTPLLTLLFTWMLSAGFGMNIESEPLDWLGLTGALLVVAGSGLAALPKTPANSTPPPST